MSDVNINVLTGDCREVLKTLPSEQFHTCITSPPYWGLRDYNSSEQLGLEKTPQEYVALLVEVFRDVRRVLRDDGTLWLNLGDSYSGSGKGPSSSLNKEYHHLENTHSKIIPDGLKPKDLVGVPWRVAFALQEDGWFLRQDIIWHKPNPMPESVQDRCTKSHEYLFLLTKSEHYFFDNESIQEASEDGVRNKRSVWSVPTRPYKEAHFATFPPQLIEPCIKAGSPEGGNVLDPFGGAGTTGLVADRLGRSATLVEVNPEYVDIINDRIREDAGMFSKITVDHETRAWSTSGSTTLQ